MVGFYNLLIPTNSKMKCLMNQIYSLYLFYFEKKAFNLLIKSLLVFKKVDHQTDLTIPLLETQLPIFCPLVFFGDLCKTNKPVLH